MQQQQIQTPDTPSDHAVKGGAILGNDSTGKVKLSISLSEYYAYTADIWIFDSNYSVIMLPSEYEGWARHRTYMLSPGVYIVRMMVSGQVSDNSIVLRHDITLGAGENYNVQRQLEVPKLYSSAPMSGELDYASSDQAYIEAAERISRESRGIINRTVQNSGLFLFFRYPSVTLFRQKYNRKTYWQRFELIDGSGVTLLRFPEHCDISDDDGYLGVCLQLPEGSYYLKYSSRNSSRMVPIYVYKDWYTQIFMTLSLNPLFGSIRFFINRESNFYSNDRNNYYVDICLDKLQNGDFEIEPELVNSIAHGKFESPMLGLLGAFLYLNSKETKNDQLFRTITKNLQERILHNWGDSPDILALKLLANEHFGIIEPLRETVAFSRTPMLRIAFDIIRRNASKIPWLIRSGSIDDFIVEKQVFDSPYNTFRPLRRSILTSASRLDGIADVTLDTDSNVEKLQSTVKNIYPKARIAKYSVKSHNNKDTIQAPTDLLWAYKKHGTTGAAIFGQLEADPGMSTAALAQSLSLPESTVSRVRRGLKL